MHRFSVLLAVVSLMAISGFVGAGQALPVLPKSDYPIIADCNYPNDAAAQAAWSPMSGSAPVSVADSGARKALRMPCNFAGTKIERASWDLSIALDLVLCQGIQFRFFCANPSPVSHFTFFFQSGKGWYAASFHPAMQTGWQTIAIPKTDTNIEGSPSGWGKIERLRISAWRGQDTNIEFYVSDIGLVGTDASIVVVRAESAAAKSPNEARAISQFSQTVAKGLEALGLPCLVISDRDVTPERLRGKQIAILPHNPTMPDETVDTLIQYVQGGGKLISFYTLPSQLYPIVGIERGRHIAQKYAGYFSSIHFSGHVLAGAPAVVGQKSWNVADVKAVAGKSRLAAEWWDEKGQPTGNAAVVVSDNCIHMTHVLLDDDPNNKRQMLLAMVGHFMPKTWEQAARSNIEHIGKIGPYGNFQEAESAIRRMAEQNPRVLRLVDEAAKIRNEAVALSSAGKHVEAISKANEASNLMLDVYCSAQKPKPGEHRAFWCHSAFGVAGMEWDEAIKNLADNGFTAILPNMLWGGVAYYDSKVLPVAPEIKEKGDQIAKCVAACKKYGVQCHVWKVNWNMGSRAPKEFLEQMRKEGRTQVRRDGAPEDRWLCPSHPENQKLEVASMVEVATQYDVDGIHFDYIRYPDGQSCFCNGCRRRFEKSAGAEIKNWPADVLKDERLRQKWLDFRRDNITTVVAAVNLAARKAKPTIKISAAVFRNWPTDRDSVGQDWKLWCEKGYLDFVCPMDYTPSNAEFENMVSLQLGWAGKVPCYPGIGLGVWTPRGDICKLIDQINITRRLGTGGFTVFNYGELEARDVAPLSGKGITRRQ
jgi:uncharacterized lipoprotein YddW (UPF0748 family)